MKIKMKPFRHNVIVNNKKYEYTITPINKKEVFFKCPVAKISQEFLAEDIPALLIDLPELILDEFEYQKEVKQKAEIIRFRISPEEKMQVQKKAVKAGYSTISAFIRALALGA